VAAALGSDHPRLAVVRADGTTELWRLDPDLILGHVPALSAHVSTPVQGTFYPAVSFWAGDEFLVQVGRATHASPDLIDIFFLTQREHRLIRSSHKGALNNFAISGDGTLLATTAWDGTLRLWDVRSGRELKALRGQLISFTSAAFSPDKARLVAGGYDGSVTIWDLDSGQQVASWRATRQQCFVGFADAGQLLLTSGEAIDESRFELTLWRAPTFDQIAVTEAALGITAR
jgi:WD40 repeat protein